jgi:aspartate carbamoyltransferase catalytic subunit
VSGWRCSTPATASTAIPARACWICSPSPATSIRRHRARRPGPVTACGADVVLCGPPTLVPDLFAAFTAAPPPGQAVDPVPERGRITVERSLERALPGADAVMTLRLQKERMRQHLLTSLDTYHRLYGLSQQRMALCGRPVPLLHPGPVNRGVELAGDLLDDPSLSLVDEQVRNGIPVRMALLYLLAAGEAAAASTAA